MKTSLFFLAFFLLSAVAEAQSQPLARETIRGRVTDDSAKALAGAIVSITRGPDRLTQQDTTDADGRYSSTFENGTGDYLVHVAAVGYRSARRRVQRENQERELIADFTLSPDLTLLDTVKVKATERVRARATSTDIMNRGIGASETWDQGVQGRVSPNSAGNTNAIAGTIPGITMTPNGPSILGASTSSNLTTLNGMAMPMGSLPRAAEVYTRVSGATYDATQGGFSGANIEMRLSAGNRDFQLRRVAGTFNVPQLQATDALGRSQGLLSSGFRTSVGADGEAIQHALAYNIAVDVSRDVRSPSTLFGANESALLGAGILPDSIKRLQSVAQTVGVPVAASGIPSSQVSEGVSFLGRLDDVRDTLKTRALTAFGSFNKQSALGSGLFNTPSTTAAQRQRSLGGQLEEKRFIGGGYFTLVMNRLSGSIVENRIEPYLMLPSASLLLASGQFNSDRGMVGIALGGSSLAATLNRRWTAEASNQIVWNAQARKHRFNTALWLRGDGLATEGQSNTMGSYSYASLEDLANNRPSSYSRRLSDQNANATTLNGAAAFSHEWRPNRNFNAISGIRIEANSFGSTPLRNSALEESLGVRTDIAPRRLHVSPRMGFSYVYSQSRNNQQNLNINTGYSEWYRMTTGIIRGGIGEFRDLYRPDMLIGAMSNSGLVGSSLTLSCVGAAVPIPDWAQLVGGGENTLPTTCRDGSGLLGERAPSVTALNRNFDAPRSWRATLGWESSILGLFVVKVDGLASYDLSQPSSYDANFSGVRRFALNEEAGRPVFVSPSSIDASSGAVSASESRKSSNYGRVSLLTSDLRGYGSQITTTLQPDFAALFRNNFKMPVLFSASYTLQRVWRQFRGNDGGSGSYGDPRAVEWAAGSGDARHAFVIQASTRLGKFGAINLFSRIQSGLPFTPIVRSDIDGDGIAGDRAFIPNPNTYADPTVRSEMLMLLETAPKNVVRCLSSQLGQVAGRQSCRGPWTQQVNLLFRPNLPAIAGRQAAVSIAFENPLAGLDQLLHGSGGLRGWGTSAMPDPVLLTPRGFDAQNQRYLYEVNPRFGDTRAARSITRAPFRVVLDVSMDLSTPYELQTLRRALEPRKLRDRETKKVTWERLNADSISALYLKKTSSSVLRAVLANSDSLFLSAEQIARLVRADSVYAESIRALYIPLGNFLASQAEGKASKAALDSVAAKTKQYWPIFWAQIDTVEAILNRQQIQLLPMLQTMTGITPEERLKARWFVGYPVSLVHTKPRIGGN